MSRFFISYSSTNIQTVRKVVEALHDVGFTTWWDKNDIPLGMNWQDVIQKGLETTEVMLLFVSPASMASNEVKHELSHFLASKKPIIPIILKNAKIPYRLEHNQRYEGFLRQPFDLALDNLIEHLEKLNTASLPIPLGLDDLIIQQGKDRDISLTIIRIISRTFEKYLQIIVIFILAIVLIFTCTFSVFWFMNQSPFVITPTVPLPSTIILSVRWARGIPIWAAPEQDLKHPITVYQRAELISYAKTEANGQHWYLVLIPGKDKYGWVYDQDVYVKDGDEGNLPDYDSFADAKARFPIAE